MVDITELGTTYTVIDKDSGNQRQLQIIFLETFLDEIGLFDENHFPHYNEYLEESLSVIKGCVKDIHDISWYARTEKDVDFMEAIRYGCADGNDLVIIETLPEDKHNR